MLLSWSFSSFLWKNFMLFSVSRKKSPLTVHEIQSRDEITRGSTLLYRKSIPLHLMKTESPFPIKGHSRAVFGSFRAGYSHQTYPSLSIFRTYSSCQRVIFFTCKSVYHRNQICQDLFAVIFRVPSQTAKARGSCCSWSRRL